MMDRKIVLTRRLQTADKSSCMNSQKENIKDEKGQFNTMKYHYNHANSAVLIVGGRDV